MKTIIAGSRDLFGGEEESEEAFSFINDVIRCISFKEAKFEIVKDVIATKKAEGAAELAKAAKAVKRKKILDALYERENDQINKMSKAQLEKQLAELDAESE